LKKYSNTGIKNLVSIEKAAEILYNKAEKYKKSY